ncbi:hypothetical protein ACFC96_13515 [Streptomyces sp. NPDC055955]|uniref:hypothetical protein n=1 Tax=Streptomyces sp. NPDC055955 TaxID=3345665 RepID=UPI0035D61FEC
MTSVGLHLAMIRGHGDHVSLSVAVTIMSAACLYCGVELWRAPTARVWLVVGGMNAGMVLSHLVASGLWTRTTALSPHAEHHMQGAPDTGAAGLPVLGGSEGLLGIATLVALMEITLAAAIVVRASHAHRAS